MDDSVLWLVQGRSGWGGGQGGRLHLLGYILCELEEYPKLCRKNVKYLTTYSFRQFWPKGHRMLLNMLVNGKLFPPLPGFRCKIYWKNGT